MAQGRMVACAHLFRSDDTNSLELRRPPPTLTLAKSASFTSQDHRTAADRIFERTQTAIQTPFLDSKGPGKCPIKMPEIPKNSPRSPAPAFPEYKNYETNSRHQTQNCQNNSAVAKTQNCETNSRHRRKARLRTRAPSVSGPRRSSVYRSSSVVDHDFPATSWKHEITKRTPGPAPLPESVHPFPSVVDLRAQNQKLRNELPPKRPRRSCEMIAA